MANVLKRKVGPQNVASGTSTVLTVAAFFRQTVRHVRVVNNTAGMITFKIGIGGVTDSKLLTHAIDIPTKETYVEDMKVTLEETETLQVNASASGLTLTVECIEQN